MRYKVSISHEAKEDLRGIYAYITFNLLSPGNAQGQINSLEKAILSLDEFPLRHRLVDFEPWKSRGLYVMLCDNFFVFYIVEEEKQEVFISRVLYGKRNFKGVLGEYKNSEDRDK
ncbi:toxin ParE1/3/4 [Peptococcus niger]|uniref:Toxin ParE1/3/4 n=1 Tax=Peptococcus niger TaxID=2741 RepID=A0A1G6VVH9_PEPNI|nr:type II toxin-antitoxin system RelE/ParE family toxin [Peptococcus niger]MBS5593930.1 type II toxin-antitoxin system RelE/ParE family toxin [Clostridiales bacterium]SDD57690.1 toxin ParE1/3/4 [Peptococcus niger]